MLKSKSLRMFVMMILLTTNAHSIMNGHEDIHNEYENVVKLSVLDDQKRWNICSATIISDHAVLTAGHCIGYYLNSNAKQSIRINKKAYKINNVVPHPGFFEHFRKEESMLQKIREIQKQDRLSPELPKLWLEFGQLAADTAHFDIALIITDKAISKGIPRTRINYDKAFFGESVVLVGFGFNRYDSEQSRYIYDNGVRRYYGNAILDFEDDLYATYDTTGNSPVSAQGDSGGPLLNSKGEQIGVVSHGSSLRRGTIYTPTWFVKSFLESSLKSQD